MQGVYSFGLCHTAQCPLGLVQQVWDNQLDSTESQCSACKDRNNNVLAVQPQWLTHACAPSTLVCQFIYQIKTDNVIARSSNSLVIDTAQLPSTEYLHPVYNSLKLPPILNRYKTIK